MPRAGSRTTTDSSPRSRPQPSRPAPAGKGKGPTAEGEGNKGPEATIRLAGEKACNLFETHQMLCSEAVLSTLNAALGGDLDQATALKITSALPMGMGGAGCVCGALTGGLLALGLFLGRTEPGARDRYGAREAAREYHDLFKARFGSTCCRVLTIKVKGEKPAHHRQCVEITAAAAEMGMKLILARRPELAQGAAQGYLERRDSRLAGLLKRVRARLKGRHRPARPDFRSRP